jgi:hypothetical protein
MSHRLRLSIKKLGASILAALGLMTLMAAGAQAAALWDVLLPREELPFNEAIDIEDLGEGLLSVPAKNLVIHCKKLVDHGALLAAATGTAQGTLLYSECLTLASGVDQPLCKPIEPITAAFLVLQELAVPNGAVKLLAEHLPGQTKFATLEFPATCALLSKIDLKGSVLLECLSGPSHESLLSCAHDRVAHYLRPTAAQTGDSLSFGLSPATLSGVVEVKMSGAAYGGKLFNAWL